MRKAGNVKFAAREFRIAGGKISAAVLWMDESVFRPLEIRLHAGESSSLRAVLLKKHREENCRGSDSILDELGDFFAGRTSSPRLRLPEMDGISPFGRKILLELRRIAPVGKTVSYGRLAESAGFPGAARAVGTVMRKNPFPIFFPCHRVILRNGDCGKFQGGGRKLKRLLLAFESKYPPN